MPDPEIDWNSYPPAPVLWISGGVDILCYPLQCSNWRSFLNIAEDSAWSHKVPSMFDHLPDMMTYKRYLDNENIPVSLESLRTYMLEPSTALSNLATLDACVAVFFLLLLLRTTKAILFPLFRKLGRYVGRKTHGDAWLNHNQERIHKFGEYVFRLVFHSTISLYGILYFQDKPWWQIFTFDIAKINAASLTLYQGFPNHPVEPGMAWYYLLQAAYNMEAMIALLEISIVVKFQPPKRQEGTIRSPILIEWSPTVRGDFREMFVHHVITNLLIYGSSMCRLTRIGSMVFLVHDISDVPVDLSKLANFLKYKYTTFACFLSMVLTWICTRLGILPFVIYRSILLQSSYVTEGVPVLLYLYYRYIFYVLVAALILLHVAWFGMFIKMFTTFVVKSECHDLSEHKQGERHTKDRNGSSHTVKKND